MIRNIISTHLSDIYSYDQYNAEIALIEESFVSDPRLLHSYYKQQTYISRGFLTGLSLLAQNIISELEDVQIAKYAVSNLLEELDDPIENKSHLQLLHEFGLSLESDKTVGATWQTELYKSQMISGLESSVSGYVYLATMEYWMQIEFDMLERVCNKADVSEVSLRYFTANREADLNHIDESEQGIKLVNALFHISDSQLTRVIGRSFADRLNFWTQFLV